MSDNTYGADIVRTPAGWGYVQAEGKRKRPLYEVPRVVNRLPPDTDWITAERAAQILCTSLHTIYRLPESALRRKSRSRAGKQGLRGAGGLYCLADVEAILRARREAGLPIALAAQVALAMREGRL